MATQPWYMYTYTCTCVCVYIFLNSHACVCVYINLYKLQALLWTGYALVSGIINMGFPRSFPEQVELQMKVSSDKTMESVKNLLMEI